MTINSTLFLIFCSDSVQGLSQSWKCFNYNQQMWQKCLMFIRILQFIHEAEASYTTNHLHVSSHCGSASNWTRSHGERGQTHERKPSCSFVKQDFLGWPLSGYERLVLSAGFEVFTEVLAFVTLKLRRWSHTHQLSLHIFPKSRTNRWVENKTNEQNWFTFSALNVLVWLLHIYVRYKYFCSWKLLVTECQTIFYFYWTVIDVLRALTLQDGFYVLQGPSDHSINTHSTSASVKNLISWRLSHRRVTLTASTNTLSFLQFKRKLSILNLINEITCQFIVNLTRDCWHHTTQTFFKWSSKLTS